MPKTRFLEKCPRRLAGLALRALLLAAPLLLIGVASPDGRQAADPKPIAPASIAASTAATRPGAPAAGERPLLIRGARVFDGREVVPVADVLVRGGRIVAVGRTVAAPADAELVDGSGKTLLPGLIDAHAHVYGPALRQALVFGITTELDMFTDPRLAAQIKADQAAGRRLDEADLRSAGILATAPKGHGTEYGFDIPTVTSPGEARGWVDARIAEGSDYIKIVYDDARQYGLLWPTISKDTLTALVTAAHLRGKLAVVHIGTLAGARDAIEAGADGLAHLFVDHTPDPELGRFAAAHHVFVVPTLTVLESVTGVASGASLLKDPRLAPYIPAAAAANLQRSFPGGHGHRLETAQAAVRLLAAAGVPILAGTDAPNPGTGHGVSLHRELELLVQGGLTPVQALTAATAAPAAAFRLLDRGRIAKGLRADLLLVDGDPTHDILATRAIVAVWKLGTAVDRAAYRAAVAREPRPESRPPLGAAGSGKISDFDGGGPEPQAAFGAGWMVSTDQLMGGKSQGAMQVVPGSATSSGGGSLAISGEILPGAPYGWAGALFSPGAATMMPADLSARKGIRFWAKGDGKTYRLMVFTRTSVQQQSFPTQTFVAGTEWKEYDFPFSAFGTDAHDLMGILFTGGPALGTFAFQIDDVSFD
jgi:imidazolonepropionase-like amidohydrolase